MIPKKKLVLWSVVAGEILVAVYFGSKIWTYSQSRIKGSQSSKVTIIPKSETVHINDGEFEHYYQLGPGSWQEKPEWLPYSVTYHINQDGLREFKNYSVAKPDNTFRIIALGDSFTYGHQVNGSDVWTERLERQLNQIKIECGFDNFEVINLGMPGFDVQYIVKRYQEIGQKYSPDLILWFEPGFGFSRHIELTNAVLENCIEEKSEGERVGDNSQLALGIHYYCSNKAYREIRKKFGQKKLNELLYNQYDKFFKLDYSDRTTLFYFDDLPQENIRFIEQLKQKHPELTHLSLLPGFTENDLLPDGHPTVESHQMIADKLTEYLVDEVLECNRVND